ncbi:serine hydrolase [Nocardia sp. NPDC050717]|uniref:serine hydrolase domain-containing protein n=1 Tax=Nocardia sp. NPDC050717 TaxID=3157221 RepID=UPI0033FDA8FA
MILALGVALSVTVSPIASATPDFRCAESAPGAAPERAAPEQVGMDDAAVAEALRFGAQARAHAIQIYRHGCLVGDYGVTGDAPMPLFSASKGVTAVAVGRAVTLGYFGIDDPLGTFFPAADAEHAAITVRQVLNQTTGLHFSWPADIATMATDAIGRTLASPARFAPGTTFQYAQAVLSLLPKIIEITTGMDFQDFVDAEVLSPLGIDRGDWVWSRDRAGTTSVAGGLAMRPADLARIGQMLLREGTWGGQRLIDREFLRQAVTPTAANGGYGFLWWLNAGETYRGVNVPMPVEYPHRLFPGLPHDAYAFSGALGQFLVVVPSRDMVIVRLGVPATIDPDNITGFLTGTSNPDNRLLFHRVVAAVRAQPEPLDDPNIAPDPVHRPGATPEERAALLDAGSVLDILLGAGVYAADTEGPFGGVAGLGAQVAAAVGATATTPR